MNWLWYGVPGVTFSITCVSGLSDLGSYKLPMYSHYMEEANGWAFIVLEYSVDEVYVRPCNSNSICPKLSAIIMGVTKRLHLYEDFLKHLPIVANHLNRRQPP